MRIQLPVKVDNIIKTLEAAGYEAFAVGGCIRDSVLGRTPQDWGYYHFGKAAGCKTAVFTYDRYRNPTWNRNGHVRA